MTVIKFQILFKVGIYILILYLIDGLVQRPIPTYLIIGILSITFNDNLWDSLKIVFKDALPCPYLAFG